MVVTIGGVVAVYAAARVAPAAGGAATAAGPVVGTDVVVAKVGAAVVAVTAGANFASDQLDAVMEAAKTSLDQRNVTCDTKANQARENARAVCDAATDRARPDGVAQLELPVPSEHGECPIGTEFRQAGTPIVSCVRTEVSLEWEDGEQTTHQRHCKSYSLTQSACVRTIEL